MRPRWLYAASVVSFLLFIGALQSEGRLSGDTAGKESNSLTPVFGILWPALLVLAIVASVQRARKKRKAPLQTHGDNGLGRDYGRQETAPAATAAVQTLDLARQTDSGEVHQLSEAVDEWSSSDFLKFGIRPEIGAVFDSPSGRHQVTAIFYESGQPTGFKSRRIIPQPDEDLEELAPREADSEESDLGSTEAMKDFTNSKDPIQLIHELGKLRDAGLLTEEEFQAKKRDLLDRL